MLPPPYTINLDYMNRHQRRAAGRQPNQSEPGDFMPTVSVNMDDPGRPSGNPYNAIGTPDNAVAAPAPQKPSLILRILAKILLSSWVLNRVQHPDIERLLIAFATQVNRPEVADHLIRRALKAAIK